MGCILIYSKNTLFREYLGKIVKDNSGTNNVISIDNTSRLDDVFTMISPDFILVDMYSRNFDDDFMYEVVKYFSGKQIILITTEENRHLNYYYYAFGIRHFIYAENQSENIVSSLLDVLSGNGANGKFRSANSILTGRECEILKHIASGKTSKEIAEMLCISKNTVDTHRNKMLQKLNLANSASLVHYAYRSGLF